MKVEGMIFRRTKDGPEYLLLKRLPERNGFWQPVTGGVEDEETHEEALYREVFEETGVRNLLSFTECLLRTPNASTGSRYPPRTPSCWTGGARRVQVVHL